MVAGHKVAFVEHIGWRQIVVGTTTDSSFAAVSKPYILSSPRNFLVAVAAVVVAGSFVHIVGHIGATVECKNYSGCSFDHMCPTLAGYSRKYSKMPSDSD